MADKTNLYSILMSYANKHHSPSIDIESFITFLEKYARRYAPDQPAWKKWTTDTRTKFWSELSPLIDEKKCTLINDNRKSRVFIVDFYTDLINQKYEFPDSSANSPFPDEMSLGVKIPEDMLRSLNLEDLPALLEEPQESALPILKISFPDGLSPMLALGPMIPQKVMQATIYKIRNHLRNQNNYEYIHRRLIPQMSGKENFVKDMLYKLDLRPTDCQFTIETGGEFACVFWPYFCAAVKAELKKKSELLTQDLAALQSVYLLEIFVYFYKTLASKERTKELAFKTLELKLTKPPHIFTLDNITKFKDANGQDLLKLYSMKELEAFLKQQTTEAASDQVLPELLIFRNKTGEQVFINKSKIFPLCARLLGETRNQVRKAVTKRWTRLLRKFETEPAMEHDQEFEKLLHHYIYSQIPLLMILLRDKRLYLLQEELERTQGAIPETSRIYSKRAELIPLVTLLMLKRKDILTDCRIMLPVWYSIPVVSSIIAFFVHIAQGSSSVKEEDNDGLEGAAPGEAPAPGKTIAALVQQCEQEMVPAGSSLDSYLKQLEGRWKKLLNKDAKKRMVTDIHNLIKQKLRRLLQINRTISVDALQSMAQAIIMETPALKELDTIDSVRLYITLTIVKLLKK